MYRCFSLYRTLIMRKFHLSSIFPGETTDFLVFYDPCSQKFCISAIFQGTHHSNLTIHICITQDKQSYLDQYEKSSVCFAWLTPHIQCNTRERPGKHVWEALRDNKLNGVCMMCAICAFVMAEVLSSWTINKLHQGLSGAGLALRAGSRGLCLETLGCRKVIPQARIYIHRQNMKYWTSEYDALADGDGSCNAESETTRLTLFFDTLLIFCMLKSDCARHVSAVAFVFTSILWCLEVLHAWKQYSARQEHASSNAVDNWLLSIKIWCLMLTSPRWCEPWC